MVKKFSIIFISYQSPVFSFFRLHKNEKYYCVYRKTPQVGAVKI